MNSWQIDVPVPDGACGDWRIDTFTITREQADLHNLMCRSRVEHVVPGTYKKLTYRNTVVMSNTPMEVATHREIIMMATGRVLLNGLGLGMVLTAILAKPAVTEVYVIEKSAEVLSLVAPSFPDSRVVFTQHDALTYRPPAGLRFAAVWHDIWDAVCEDNLIEMGTLHRKYGRRADWQGSWARRQCERAAKGGWR